MSAFLREQLHESAAYVRPLGDIDEAITSGIRHRNRTLALAGVAGMIGVAILAVVLLGAGPGVSQPEPLEAPTPTPTMNLEVRGWPGTSRNAAGVYSFDGFDCGGGRPRGSCPSGAFMHNGYGSGDVDIRVHVSSEAVVPDNGGTDVSIAGHEGTHRQITAWRESWTFKVEGTPVAIDLVAAPGTSQADLAEAHAIIDSMYTEPFNTDLGFRLVFTLTSNDWDSG